LLSFHLHPSIGNSFLTFETKFIYAVQITGAMQTGRFNHILLSAPLGKASMNVLNASVRVASGLGAEPSARELLFVILSLKRIVRYIQPNLTLRLFTSE
jgi:hypothetical protein